MTKSTQNKFAEGSRWIKCDLHIHTPVDYSWDKKCKATSGEIVNKALSENLSLIAITDHHSVLGIDETIRAAKGKDVTVLPGVEIRTDKGNKKIHIIGIFNELTLSKIIYDQLLCPLGFSDQEVKKTGNEQIYCNFEKACDLIHELGGLVFLHAGNKSNGIEQIDSDIKSLLKTNLVYRVDILEITGKKQFEKYRDIVFPQIDKELPCLITSDACTRETLTYKEGHSIEVIGKKYSWIKACPTFQGLKQIVYEPELRVCLDNKPPAYLHPQFLSISVEAPDKYLDQEIPIKDRFCFGGFSEKVLLNPNLNSIVGGRATGKSTLLELLGFVFNKYRLSLEKDKPSIIEFLQQHFPEVKIKVEFKFGEKKYQIERCLNQGEIDRLGFDLIYLPQDEIEKQARDDRQITALINSLIDETKLRTSRSGLESKRLILEKLRNTYSQKFEKMKALKIAREEAQKVQLVLNFTQSSQYKILATELTTKIKEREKINSSLTGIHREIEILNRTKQELSETLDFEITSLIGYISNPKNYSAEEIIKQLNAIISRLETAEKIIQNSTKYIQLKKDIEKLHNKYLNACRDLGIDTINQSKIKEALENKSKIEIKIKQLEQELREIISSKVHHNSNLKEYQLDAKKNNGVEKELIENAKTKFGNDLQIRSEESKTELHQGIIELFKHYEKLSGRVGLKETDISSTIENLSLSGIIAHLKNQSIPKGYENTLTANYFFKDDEFTHREILIMHLEELFPQKNFIITFKGKKLHEMSFGERCGVVLRLILSNSNLPLVIDQPEDHLDNKYIVKELLELIRSKKLERQITLSTHNPNIVVNGDSELITVLELDSAGYSKVEQGSLEDSTIKKKITVILEGGKEAFIKREKKYEFFK